MSGVAHQLGTARRRLGLAAAVVAALATAACAPTVEPQREAPADGPLVAAIAAAQAERLGLLLPLKASGQVELRWTDEGGNRFEFCRGDLYVRSPADVALDLRKAGERFMYLGCDAERGWVFTLHEEPRRLATWRHGSHLAGDRLGGVTAFDLVDLAGLGPWSGDGTPSRLEDGTIVFETDGLGGRLRVAADPARLVPLRIESLAADGSVRLRSDLEAYRAIDLPGLPPGALPRMPERVRIVAAERDTILLLSLGTVDAQSPSVRPALFDLDRLTTVLRPEVVDDLGAP